MPGWLVRPYRRRLAPLSTVGRDVGVKAIVGVTAAMTLPVLVVAVAFCTASATAIEHPNPRSVRQAPTPL